MGFFTKKPITIQATRWFKNGDHPQDQCRELISSEGKPFLSEGKVVRYYRHPEDDGRRICGAPTVVDPQVPGKGCGNPMHYHGWIDTLEGGHNVCPGDWIITGVKGEMYPCKPDIFEATYYKASANDTLCASIHFDKLEDK